MEEKNIKWFVLGLLSLFIINCLGCSFSDGDDGVRGAIGEPGTSCSVFSSPGGALISCTDGSSQFVANGSNGTNGTSIGIVSLCTATTVYPLVFTEVAFCIGTDLYAVYSANNGFLTLLPPGTYQSNGINSSCNIVVHPNCIVTR